MTEKMGNFSTKNPFKRAPCSWITSWLAIVALTTTLPPCTIARVSCDSYPLTTVELWIQNGAKFFLKANCDFATLLSIWHYLVYNCDVLSTYFWKLGLYVIIKMLLWLHKVFRSIVKIVWKVTRSEIIPFKKK